MNFMILLILSLVITGFALLALVLNLILRKKQPVKDGSITDNSAEYGKNSGCGCGRGNCCAIE
jgi:hypothetical protein